DGGGRRRDERPRAEEPVADEPAAERRRGDLRNRAERLREAEDDALLARVGALRDEARERRAQHPLPGGRERRDAAPRPDRVREPEPAVARGHRHESDRHQLRLAEARDEPADEPALEDDAEEAGVGEEIADLARPERVSLPRERPLREEREA